MSQQTFEGEYVARITLCGDYIGNNFSNETAFFSNTKMNLENTVDWKIFVVKNILSGAYSDKNWMHEKFSMANNT